MRPLLSFRGACASPRLSLPGVSLRHSPFSVAGSEALVPAKRAPFHTDCHPGSRSRDARLSGVTVEVGRWGRVNAAGFVTVIRARTPPSNGRAHVLTPVPDAHSVCRRQLEKQKTNF